MKQSLLELVQKHRLTVDVWELRFAGDLSAVTRPGQFVNLSLPGKFLRRPVSVSDWTPETLTLLVKTAGEGTRELVSSPDGARFDTLTGLGNGFSLPENVDFTEHMEHIILAGGGIGLAPLYGLAKLMKQHGIPVTVAMGFRSADDVFYTEQFTAQGCETIVATADGSMGQQGFVTDLLQKMPRKTYVYTCGPLPMLKAVHTLPHLTGGQFSLEARMGCGFGVCMGCSIPTAHGYKRVCTDGPVCDREELLWTAE